MTERLWSEQRTIVERADLTKVGLKGSHKLVLLILHGFADVHGKAWPSQATIAARCCIGVNTVASVLSDLAEARIVASKPRIRDDGGRSSNMMFIDFDVLEPLVTPPTKFWGGVSPKSVGTHPKSDGGPSPNLEGAPPQNLERNIPVERSNGEVHRARTSAGRGPAVRKEPEGHQRWVDTFTAQWAASHQGTPYAFDGGKDGSTIRALRKQLGDDHDVWARLVRHYLADRDSYLVRVGHPLTSLRQRVHGYLPKCQGVGNTTRSAADAPRVERY